MAEAAGNSLRTRTKRTHTYTRLQQRAWPAQLRPPPCMGSDELNVPVYDAGVLSHEDALTGHNASNPAVIGTAPRMRSKVRALRLHRAPGCDPGYGASSDNFEPGFAQDESGGLKQDLGFPQADILYLVVGRVLAATAKTKTVGFVSYQQDIHGLDCRRLYKGNLSAIPDDRVLGGTWSTSGRCRNSLWPGISAT